MARFRLILQVAVAVLACLVGALVLWTALASRTPVEPRGPLVTIGPATPPQEAGFAASFEAVIVTAAPDGCYRHVAQLNADGTVTGRDATTPATADLVEYPWDGPDSLALRPRFGSTSVEPWFVGRETWLVVPDDPNHATDYRVTWTHRDSTEGPAWFMKRSAVNPNDGECVSTLIGVEPDALMRAYLVVEGYPPGLDLDELFGPGADIAPVETWIYLGAWPSDVVW